MHVQPTIVTLLALICLTIAYPRSASHVLHEKRELTHPRWVKRSEIPSSAKLPMRIGLTQSNLDKGMDYIMDV